MATIGILGAAVAFVIAALGIEADGRPYVLIGGWLLVGIAYWLATAGRRRPAR